MAAEAGVTEGIFAGAGSEAGLLVWRIEDLAPVAVEPAFHGQFYQGDSYILLHSRQAGRRLVHNIHFWLGSETTSDEKGAAARLSVDLDDALGGSPKEYREVEGHESDLFLSYFRHQGGVEYLPGGIASGFNHVVPEEHKPRLLHVKGRRNVRVNEVPINVASLNHGDVFVLDAADTVFAWFGRDSNRKEQAKGIQVAHRIRNSRTGTPVNAVVLHNDDESEAFWAAIGGSVADVADGESDDDDETKGMEPTLYQFTVEDGAVSTEVIERTEEGYLTRDMLKHDGAFFLAAPGRLYVWVGREAAARLRKKALSHGSAFLESTEMPEWSTVTRELDGGETPVFKEFFHQFDPPRPLSTAERVSSRVKPQEDLSALFKPGNAPSERPVDDGTGTTTVWRVEDMALVEVPSELHGQFFAGDAYVIKYTYTNSRNREDNLVYFWQGRNASQDEVGASAIEAIKVAAAARNAPQVRVVQGKEPNHFCALFGGTMVVHAGGIRGRFDAPAEAEEGKGDDMDGPNRLYHVKGTSTAATKATQVKAQAANLNSSDCYVVVTPDAVFAWHGKHASGDETATVGKVADVLAAEGIEVTALAEGDEPEAFWEALGGQAEYPDEGVQGESAHEPRLFQLSNALGALEATEVYNFTQDDLDTDDVFILDTWTQLFVWVGNRANEEEKTGAMKATQQFIANVDDGRDPDTPVITIQAGNEPEMFTVNFLGWDDTAAATFVDPYEKRLAELKKAAESSGATFLTKARASLRSGKKKPAVAKASSEDEAKSAEGGELASVLKKTEGRAGFVDPLEKRRLEREAAAAESEESENFLVKARRSLRKAH